MRAVVQRVGRASVSVEKRIVGSIEGGLLVLLGVAPTDDEAALRWLAEKIVNLRIFADPSGKMNLSLLDLGLGVLVVSQFTLYGDCRKGRRPAFTAAAAPILAEQLYSRFGEELLRLGAHRVERGVFGAHMQVELVNDGPVTLIVDSP